MRASTGRQLPTRRLAGRGLAALAIIFLCALPASAEDERDFEPVPPQIFFPEPDAHHDPIIRAIIANSFADQNKTPVARERLVWQYHVWSVPALIDELVGGNHTAIINSALTVAALRDRRGPAPELWETLNPLIKIADADSMDPWQRAVGCLALGCFHWREGVDRDRYRRVPDILNPDRSGAMQRSLQKADRVLLRRVLDDNAQVRAMALMALAKRGGDVTLQRLNERWNPKVVADPVTPWAHLLTLAFLGEPHIDPFFDALDDDSSDMKRAAALALSVGMLIDRPPEWTGNSDLILKRLSRADLSHQKQGPEAVFAMGVCIWKFQKILEWKRLWHIAETPSTKTEIAIAAAQMLLFCEERWFLDAAIRVAAGNSGRRAAPPVLAMCLLHAGQHGTRQGIEAVREYLRDPAERPRAEGGGWDVRFHAAVGLLRALHLGRIEDKELREQAVEALEDAVKTGMAKDAPCRIALERVLEEEAPKIKANTSNRISRAGLEAVENSFRCKYGLLAKDPIDACAHRVNEFMLEFWGLKTLTKGSPGDPKKDQQAQLYLKSYLDRYPYFSRVEFRHDRGWRKSVASPDDAMVFDR